MFLWFAAPPTTQLILRLWSQHVMIPVLLYLHFISSIISTHPPKVPMTQALPHGGSLTLVNQDVDVIGHAKGIETAPLALLRLRILTLDSVSSSPCSSDFLSASVARKRNVTVSHSSGSSSNRKPTQMMQVAARRTMLKITSCFSTSIAKHKSVIKAEEWWGRVWFFNLLELLVYWRWLIWAHQWYHVLLIFS